MTIIPEKNAQSRSIIFLNKFNIHFGLDKPTSGAYSMGMCAEQSSADLAGAAAEGMSVCRSEPDDVRVTEALKLGEPSK
jgi:hypothetical protein